MTRSCCIITESTLKRGASCQEYFKLCLHQHLQNFTNNRNLQKGTHILLFKNKTSFYQSHEVSFWLWLSFHLAHPSDIISLNVFLPFWVRNSCLITTTMDTSQGKGAKLQKEHLHFQSGQQRICFPSHMDLCVCAMEQILPTSSASHAGQGDEDFSYSLCFSVHFFQ